MRLPYHFTEEMKHLLGEEYTDFLASYEKLPKAGLRMNTKRGDAKENAGKLPFTLTDIPWISNGYYISGEDTPSRHPYYYAGLYYLQEPSAMTPASLLPVQPGDRVLDLCAAPGGKATELGAKLQGTGCLFANDISNSRARALLKNLELAGIANCMVTSESPERLAEAYPAYFDKILVDAPCSGEGMFRKDPGMLKNYEEKGPAFYAALQKEILAQVVRMLRPGGMLLYSTCTFSPLENEASVQFLLDLDPTLHVVPVSSYPGFAPGRPDWIEQGDSSLGGCVRIWPHRMEGEGHFAALLQKDGLNPDQERIPSGQNRKEAGNTLPKEAAAFLTSLGNPLKEMVDAGTVLTKDGRVYLLPQGVQAASQIRYLRTGLYLGEIRKKGQFEPSQALAMTLSAASCPGSVCFSTRDDRVIRYLKGETLEVDDLTASGEKGWKLICVDGFALGWGKLSGGTLKNKYCTGWRWM